MGCRIKPIHSNPMATVVGGVAASELAAFSLQRHLARSVLRHASGPGALRHRFTPAWRPRVWSQHLAIGEMLCARASPLSSGLRHVCTLKEKAINQKKAYAITNSSLCGRMLNIALRSGFPTFRALAGWNQPHYLSTPFNLPQQWARTFRATKC